MSYNPSDWYWAGVPGVYGSARGGLVSAPETDDAYLAWQDIIDDVPQQAASAWPKDSDGNVTPAALDEVLTAAGLPTSGLAEATKQQLFGYANSKVQTAILTPRPYQPVAGSTVTNNANGQTVNDLTGLLVGPAAMTESETTGWTDDIGVVTTLSHAMVTALEIEIVTYVKSVYAVLATVATKIGNGEITNVSQIDAMSWPT